jgi:hypothetical protein
MPDTGNAPDRPVFLLCHEQRLAQTKPRHGGSAALTGFLVLLLMSVTGAKHSGQGRSNK